MKVGSLHMGLTDKTVLLSLCCPVKNKLQQRESSRMDTEESWEIIIFIHNLITG